MANGVKINICGNAGRLHRRLSKKTVPWANYSYFVKKLPFLFKAGKNSYAKILIVFYL